MKYEIDDTLPEYFVPDWPLQYSIFSHFEFACGIPQSIFAISTRKENGQPNLCLQSWSSFSGNPQGYFVFLAGLNKASHTFQNILRDRTFVVNFLPCAYYDELMRSVEHNAPDEDEFAVCGLHQEAAKTVPVPRIAEAFLALECELHQRIDLDGSDSLSLLIGRVRHAAVSEDYGRGIDEKYGKGGFFFNIHSPVDLTSGRCAPVGVGTLDLERTL